MALERGASACSGSTTYAPWPMPSGGRCYGRPMTSESDPNDPDDDFEELDDDDLDDESARTAPAVTIEVNGLSLYTRHGVSTEERELGQRLVFDVVFELDECDATVTDRVEDTINYAEVCEQVALAAQERSYRTLERLCTAVADRLIDRFGAESVRVKAAKPEPPIPLPVDEVSVEVWKAGLTGLPRPRLQRGRPHRAAARGARGSSATASRSRPPPRSTRPPPRARCSTSRTS